ncbi:MAG: class I SAM-dependent methyltransferase [Spirochaetia bacterium]|jgi:SAM-dependent methyltransferase
MEKAAYQRLLALQNGHWWYAGRRKVVKVLLERLGKQQRIEILDIGSGFGGMVSCLANFGDVDVLEPNLECRQALQEMKIRTLYDTIRFPEAHPSREYDIVTMFDVLEHIENDERALKVIATKLLRRGGALVLTVPAYSWLWNRHDTLHQHFRRYTLRRLRLLLESCGYHIVTVSYFMTILFPVAVVGRKLEGILHCTTNDTSPPGWLNMFLERVFSLESNWLRVHSLPFGLSVAAVAKTRDFRLGNS